VRYADGVFSDITEQKDMERRLLKAERLAAIGETAAMVGHDLRNPLQAITAAVYVLKTELQPESEKSAEMFELVENAVLYSNKIVTNLLEYSGEMRLDLALTTPRAITEGALLLAKVPSNIVVRNLTEDQPILRVDEEKMQRAFLNLIENAFDAMPTGGELTISAKESKNYLEVKLSDTGIGMALDALTNIWKPLQTTKAKGIGLGLAICKRAIEAHGGTISVESFVGRGTTFTIIIPMRKEECRVEKIAQAI
jgi:signal transduction histidine kinase